MKTKRFLSILLSLVLVLGMLPGMSLTASAAEITPTNTSGTMTITLTIAAASVKTAPTANTLTYSGSAQTLTTTGEAEVGTMQYQLGENAKTAPTGTWTTTVPQGTDAKDYYVWYRSYQNDNNVSQAACVTATIAQASITNATVTLSETSFIYDNSEKSVTVTSVKLGDVTLTADTDYEVTSGTTGTAKNTYTVTVTGKGNYKDTATAQWSIGLATPTIETVPTASAITYGQTLADSTLTNGVAKLGDTTVEGTFTWKNTETKPAVSDSDTTEYDVVFTPTDADNYGTVECKVKLTVNKAAPTVTAPTAKTLTYTGSAQELVTAGTAEGGTMWYAVTTENTAPTDENLYTTSIPAKTEAGTYYVWYMAKGDENHNNSEADCIPVTITATYTVTYKVVGGTWSDGSTADKTETVTSGSKPASVPTGMKASEGYTGGAWDTDPADATITEAKTFTYTFTAKDQISVTVTLKVVNGSWDDGTRNDIKVTLTGYEGDELRLELSDLPGVTKPDEGYEYKSGTWTPEEPSINYKGETYGDPITKDTTYTFTYGAKATVSHTLTFKVVNGAWGDGTREDKTVELTGYEGDELRPDYSDIPRVTKPDEGYEFGSGTWTPAEPPVVMDGEAYGEPITEDTTYTYTYGKMKQAVVTEAPKAKSGLTYTGSAQELVTAGTAEGGTVVYAPGTDADTAPAASAYSETIPTGTDVGTYYVWYKAVGDADHTDTAPAGPVRVTIAEAPNVEMKTEQHALTALPQELAGVYSSLAEMKTAMLLKMTINGIPAIAEQAAFYDVELMASFDGGTTWTKATEENFPEGGLPVTLPYPEGTNGEDFDFSASHMFTVTSARLGTKAGEVETPAVTKVAQGLRMTLKGLSPVAIAWVKKEAPTPTPTAEPTATPTVTPKPVPKTGDNDNPVLWLGLILLGLIGFAAIGRIVYAAKQKKE